MAACILRSQDREERLQQGGWGGKKREACRDSGGRNLLTGMPMDFQEVDQLFSKVGFLSLASLRLRRSSTSREETETDSEQVPDVLVQVPGLVSTR